MGFYAYAKKYRDPEHMAAAYLREKFGNQPIHYPINPFALLRSEGVIFKLADFHRLEGVYIPASNSEDIPIVGINSARPITRQRYTAAHELCHHFRDSDKEISCPFNSQSSIEVFAERFAAALLMPIAELKAQVDQRKNFRGYVCFDNVLEIADYFGVSFQACIFRIAYKIHAIDGDTEADALKKRISKYKPDIARKSKHLTYTELYAGLIDNCAEQLAFEPSNHARLLFQNEYIYNDSRMEGLDVTIEQASEIVTDLRLKAQNSEYCNEENEAYLSIAGHYAMYQTIFEIPVKGTVSVYDMMGLNRKLFSYYPYPEFGGSMRRNNTVVLGSKFETADYRDIVTELEKIESDVKDYYSQREKMTVSEYVKHIVQTHHRITVVHPFPEGNGRTSRAFMNVQLVRTGLPPIYIKVEDKSEYISALSRADSTGDYSELYEVIFKVLLKSHVALTAEIEEMQ